MERFDSAALFSIFKNEDGENLLPFDEMQALLDLGDLDVPIDAPLGITASLITTEVPAANGNGQVLASTSVADSAHTRAPGWASRPSSEGGDGYSDGSDMDDDQQHHHHMQPEEAQPSATPSATAGSEQPRGRGGKGGTKATSGVKKRRQRNADQMESNRVAQQKYRQRKKYEQSALQQAVDVLTAQVAALKAVEVRAGELELANSALEATVKHQGASIVALTAQAVEQASHLDAARAALVASQAQVTAQSKIILDQQAKLRLQEQVIASLKDRLKERIDEAMLHVVPGTVCEKMVAAVKATLYEAKDVHGLQDTLSRLPEHLVNELCKSIWHVCKESWPEMRARCGQQAGGHPCMTGTA